MPGRNADEAWREFCGPIRRTVGCIDLTARVVEKRFRDGNRFIAAPAEGITFGPLSLNFDLTLRPVEGDTEWRMTTLRYNFTLVRPNDARTTIFGWHWHPNSKRSPITYPHVHVPAALEFRTRHIPTGRVSLEDVVVFGFVELGVPPAHDNARAVVQEVMDKHKQHRSWS